MAKTDGARAPRDIPLNVIADSEYKEYGTAVIEDRAIFSGIDGLKPVARRALWAAHGLGLHHNVKHDKSAKVVGETLGNYHPHGDKACYDAIVTMASCAQPLIDGEGNWGTMTEPQAAMRYTNMRISKFADLMFFDRFYLPTVDYVSNFDGSRQEPLLLPALLPNALLNGNFGIAPGVNTSSPVFTLPSVIQLIEATLDNKGVCTPQLCLAHLRFTTAYGAKVDQKLQREELKKFFVTGRGRVKFESGYDLLPDGSMRFTRFAPLNDMAKIMAQIESYKGVASTHDDSDKKDPHKVAFVIRFVRTCTGKELERAQKAVADRMTSASTFNVQVTDRYVKPNGESGATLAPSTVPKMLMDWLAYRVQLEKRACTYWLGERKKDIAQLELVRLAIKMLDVIIKLIKDKRLDDAGLVAAMCKALKIDADQANYILKLNLRQLRHLEDEALVTKIKALQKEMSGYQERIAKPRAAVRASIAGLKASLLTTTAPVKKVKKVKKE